MVSKIAFIAFVAATLTVSGASETFEDLRNFLETKFEAANVITKYLKSGVVEDIVFNYDLLARIEFIALEGLILENYDNTECIGPGRFLLWELETGAMNNSRRICNVDQVKALNKPLDELKSFATLIEDAEESCKNDQECVVKSVADITSKINSIMEIFVTQPAPISRNIFDCYVDLYATHMVMRTDEAKQNILKCVKN